jgi:Smg protein
MKDNLFELLLNLFEQSLTQLQKSHKSADQETTEQQEGELIHSDDQSLYIRTAQQNATRVLTYDEQMKMTKASYQFLMKMKLWGVIDNDCFELVMNQLHFSESRIITLQETKWTIRNILANTLNEEQLAFLDLVLYQSEDELTLH